MKCEQNRILFLIKNLIYECSEWFIYLHFDIALLANIKDLNLKISQISTCNIKGAN